MKQAEGANGDLSRRVDELSHDLANAQSENNRLNAELNRLKALVADLTDKNDHLTRENKQLSGEDINSSPLGDVTLIMCEHMLWVKFILWNYPQENPIERIWL